MNDSFNEESKTSTTSAKYLLDNYFREGNKTTRQKAATSSEEIIDKETKRAFLEDAERIGIVSNLKVN
jgi:hypothetical protein